MSFDPKTLTQNITDEAREDYKREQSAIGQEQTADYIARCLAQGEDDKITLIRSTALTLAYNLHLSFCALVADREGSDQYMKPLDDMMKATDIPDIIMVAAFLSLAKSVTEHHFAEAKRLAASGNPLAGLAAANHANKLGSAALEISKNITKDLCEMIEKGHSQGSSRIDSWSYFLVPKPKPAA